MELNDIFKDAHSKVRKEQSEKNLTSGRRTTNVSSNLDNLNFNIWSKTQYDNMVIVSKERSFPLDFTYEGFCNILNSTLSDRLRDCLNQYVNSGFHIESSPVVERIDLDKPYDKTNLEVLTWEEKRKKWNIWFSKNKINSNTKKKRAVKCLNLKTRQTMNVYPSISEAKKYMGATGHDNRIRECCEGEREQVYGYAWEYYSKEEDDSFF
jgi:hypothetical protein